MRSKSRLPWTTVRLVMPLMMLTILVLSGCDDDDEKASTVPAQVLFADNVVRTIDLQHPETVLAEQTITGLDAGETLVALDRRPANGVLYGVTSDGRIVEIDLANSMATPTATLSVKFQGTRLALSFNLLNDRMRILSDVGQNLRVTAETGATIVDAVLAFAAGDPHDGTTPRLGAATHVQREDGATTSVTLFGLDLATDTLVAVSPPNAGSLLTVGALGVQATAAALDTNRSGVVYAMLKDASTTRLYTVDASNGELTPLGIVGGGPDAPLALAIP